MVHNFGEHVLKVSCRLCLPHTFEQQTIWIAMTSRVIIGESDAHAFDVVEHLRAWLTHFQNVRWMFGDEGAALLMSAFVV